MLKNKILLIDDDEDFLDATALFLSAKGYEPLKALSGQDGFHQAKTESPDIIFLDMRMTHKDEGARIAHSLATDAATQDIPVIIVTGVGKELTECLKKENLSVKEILDKPLDPQKMLKIVEKYVSSTGDEHRKMVHEITRIVDKWKNKRGSLVMILHEIQHHYGYVPRGISFVLSNLLDISIARIYEVITFYNFFKMSQPGKFVFSVCMGTACYLKGAPQLLDELKRILGIEEGQVSDDGMFQIGVVRCVGCCGLAPVLMVNDKVFGKLTPADIKGVIDQYRNNGE